jgi:hypothetical protein
MDGPAGANTSCVLSFLLEPELLPPVRDNVASHDGIQGSGVRDEMSKTAGGRAQASYELLFFYCALRELVRALGADEVRRL